MKRLEQAQARMQNIRDQLGAIESRMDARSLIHQWMNEAEIAFHCLTPSTPAPVDDDPYILVTCHYHLESPRELSGWLNAINSAAQRGYRVVQTIPAFRDHRPSVLMAHHTVKCESNISSEVPTIPLP